MEHKCRTEIDQLYSASTSTTCSCNSMEEEEQDSCNQSTAQCNKTCTNLNKREQTINEESMPRNNRFERTQGCKSRVSLFNVCFFKYKHWT